MTARYDSYDPRVLNFIVFGDPSSTYAELRDFFVGRSVKVIKGRHKGIGFRVSAIDLDWTNRKHATGTPIFKLYLYSEDGTRVRCDNVIW